MRRGFKILIFIILSVICASVNLSSAFCSPLVTLEKDEKPVPIIMYHNVSTNQKLQNKYVISVEELEQDLACLKANGFETIIMADLINYVYKGDPLPEKPIILTFDDGDFGIVKHVYPLLQKYDMKAVVSIIGKVTDDYSALNKEEVGYLSNLTWPEVKEMSESGYVEIQNHTYNLHQKGGAKKIRGESEEAYQKRLSSDVGKLQDRMAEMLKAPATTFTYPYGAVSSTTDNILKEMGFLATLSCREKVTKVSFGDRDGLFQLGRILRPHGVSSEKLLRKITTD